MFTKYLFTILRLLTPPPNQQNDGFPLEFLLKGPQTELRTLSQNCEQALQKLRTNRFFQNKRAFLNLGYEKSARSFQPHKVFLQIRDVPTQIPGHPGHSLSKTTEKGRFCIKSLSGDIDVWVPGPRNIPPKNPKSTAKSNPRLGASQPKSTL